MKPITLARADWNASLARLPGAHILQSWEWGDFKRDTTGWQPERLAWEQDGAIVAMASVGVRRAGPFRVMYAPKGPVLAVDQPAAWEAVLTDLQRLARRRGAVWLKIDPDVIAGIGIPGEPDARDDAAGTAVMDLLMSRRWRFSRDQVQFRNTITLDLTQPESDLLAAFSQSTRRKLRIAEKAGVTIREGGPADLALLYALYAETGARDGFLIRPASYYELAWRRFIEAGLAMPLIAERDGAPIAAVILFLFGGVCWYFYGMSSDAERDAQPNVLLQWQAIRWAQARGLRAYDFWGAPDRFDESDRMWGVYQFKRGFHGTVVRHVGAWDYIPYPPLYAGYTQVLPRLMARRRGRSAGPAESQ